MRVLITPIQSIAKAMSSEYGQKYALIEEEYPEEGKDQRKCGITDNWSKKWEQILFSAQQKTGDQGID